ncbi:MAG: L,D-transpeptidase family protein [Alphaproteobacteria bacterium]|nr:L,D-transpeptidase family protein [Alphaproteobacteria bacterium]MCL2505865.1 L,D-transpeptidase family protein [Alphaproteobacteria bacterium]
MDLIISQFDAVNKHLCKAFFDGKEFQCAVGRNGVIDAELKAEGDGCTPLGRWVMRKVFYRPDRITGLATALPVYPMTGREAWCDKQDDTNYNMLVDIDSPSASKDERFWREDHIYDISVVLGYNDEPIRPGKGSTIFLHIARDGYSGTAGCIALSEKDLRYVLERAVPGSAVDVSKYSLSF